MVSAPVLQAKKACHQCYRIFRSATSSRRKERDRMNQSFPSMVSGKEDHPSPIQQTDENNVSIEDSDQLRVVVDLNRCQGYAQCCFLAPEVFQLVGEEALMYDGGPDVALSEKIQRAAVSCPVQAIVVEWTKGHKHQEQESQRDQWQPAQEEVLRGQK
jgi:ferredoxin